MKLNILLVFEITFVSLCLCEIQNYTACMPKDLLYPCHCHEYHNHLTTQTILYCGGHDDYDFGLLFEKISKNLLPKERHFDWLYINNTQITELNEHFFSNITFTNIVFDQTYNLSTINENTFSKMNDSLQFIYAYKTGLDIYRAFESHLNKLKNLIRLDIMSDTLCPTSVSIEPCICYQKESLTHPFSIKIFHTIIECKSESYDLVNIFNNISTTNTTLYFDELIVRNIDYLPENSFSGVDFGLISIEDSPQLKSIDENAFTNNSMIQFMRISNVNLSSENIYQTFKAINGLRQLRFLYIWSTDISYIPSNAFSKPQTLLKAIYLYGNQIETIESFAFKNIPNIESIILDGNQINSISKFAFSSIHSSNKDLKISLVSNPLNSSSFEFLAFGGSQRPIKLFFADRGGCDWGLTYLEETVFAPFLDSTGNQIYLEPECQLLCDCKMKWLVELPQHMKERISLVPMSRHQDRYSGGYVPCDGGHSLFEFNVTELDLCYE